MLRHEIISEPAGEGESDICLSICQTVAGESRLAGSHSLVRGRDLEGMGDGSPILYYINVEYEYLSKTGLNLSSYDPINQYINVTDRKFLRVNLIYLVIVDPP